MDIPIEIWWTIRWIAGGILIAMIGLLIGPFFGKYIIGWVLEAFGL